MRRGELAGLRWSDWNQTTHSISVARARQSVGGRSTEVPARRRTVDDASTSTRTPKPSSPSGGAARNAYGHPVGLNDPIFTNPQGAPVHPETMSQLFTRQLARIDLPTIRFHDLRHTHASLLAASSTPIKVVSERLGHAHPGFTMATYQHVMPGMGASAAHTFAQMLTTQRDITERLPTSTPSRPAAGRRLPVRIRKRPGSRNVAPTAGR